MKRTLFLILFCTLCVLAQAQHTFQGTSLSEALIELDKSSKHYDISFVYDELEDFTVTKTVKRGRSLPDAVREVCGFYPVRVSVKGRDILVECIQKDRTKLMGRLVGPDRQPIAYANIILYSPSDTIILDGGVSNEAGDFVIPCSAERARVRISCIGFKTIERQMPISNVGTIQMQTENNYLGNVTVSGRMPVFRSESNRLQYIVSNDKFARGLNAQELLSRVPMVSMAGGRAMILGRGPAQFMLNGHLTEMGNEAIQQKLWTMRSEDIECIEVISNPSGREMMEMGGGGYINIVMRRDQTLGWRGDISAEAGVSSDWSERGSGSVSYASKKFDMTIDAHGGRTTQTTDEVTQYYYINEEGVSDRHSKRTDNEVAANLMLRYMPIKQLEFGGMLSWQSLRPGKKIDGVITHPSRNPASSETELLPNHNTKTKNLTAYFDWRIDSIGKQLSFTYNNYVKKEDTQINYLFYNAQPRSQYSNFDNVDYHIQSGKLDLSLPFKYVTIDAGASFTNIKNHCYVDYTPDPEQFYTQLHHNYDYKEKDRAAYLSLGHEWEKGSIKAGLRYEHIGLIRDVLYTNSDPIFTDYSTLSTYSIKDKVFSRDYWLPSFSISLKPKDGHQISCSWGTSTIRPNFYDLNPTHIDITAFERIEGNPNLQPSRTSHIELSYHNHRGFYASAYHHHASNVVDWSTTTKWDTSNNVMSSPTNNSPTNNGRINKTGLYLNYQRQLSPMMMATVEGEAYYHDYNVLLLMYDYYSYSAISTLQQKEVGRSIHGWGERLALSADWYLNRQHTLLLNARYQHWFTDYQGASKYGGYGYFYFALRYSMLNDRLKLSLVANDPFNQYITDETRYNIWSLLEFKDHIQPVMYSHINHHAHYLGLTATYSFGGKKVRRIHHDTKDTEQQRAEKQN